MKHYSSRQQWARIALEAWNAKGSAGFPIPKPTPVPPSPVQAKPGGLSPAIAVGAFIVLVAAILVAFL